MTEKPPVNRETVDKMIALIETTIKNKKALSRTLVETYAPDVATRIANQTTVKFLEVNVEELQRIVNDLKSL